MVSTSVDAHGGVLVGHDGSSHSDGALQEALRLAAALGCPVTVVRAWSLSSAPSPGTWERGYVPPLDDFEAATLAELENDVASWRARFPEVQIETRVAHASPSATIIAASETAQLVVVGRRGRGGFASLLLGSVSDQIVRHAKCTVVVAQDAPGERTTDSRSQTEIEAALISELKLD